MRTKMTKKQVVDSIRNAKMQKTNENTNYLIRRFISVTIIVGMIFSVVSMGQVGFATGTGVKLKETFVTDDGKSKKYVVVTKNEETAKQIEQTFNIDQDIIQSESKDMLNSSYLGDSTFEEQVDSIGDTMSESCTTIVDLSANELEQVENSDNVVYVEEDFILRANSLKGKKSHINKRTMLEKYMEERARLKNSVEPDWNMKAIDAGKLIRYRKKSQKGKEYKVW